MNEQESQLQENKAEDAIDLLELLGVLLKRIKMIIIIPVLATAFSVYYALSLTNTYLANAVIKPTEGKGGGLSSLASQFGGLASLAGISMPSSSGSSELIVLLNSRILKEKVIKNYNLLPVFFEDAWDEKQGKWKGSDVNDDTEKVGPSVWDGIRQLGAMLRVSENKLGGTIYVAIEYHDPEMAAKILTYCLEALTDHLTESARHVADINKKYLEKQISRTADPIIKQKIYGLIAQQVETAMMTEVKENFAFKILDPPRAPDIRFRPQRSRIVVLTFIGSFAFSILLAFVLGLVEKNRKESNRTVRKQRMM